MILLKNSNTKKIRTYHSGFLISNLQIKDLKMKKVFGIKIEYLNFKDKLFPSFSVCYKNSQGKLSYDLYELLLKLYSIPPSLKDRNLPSYNLSPVLVTKGFVRSIDELLEKNTINNIQLIRSNIDEKYSYVIAQVHGKKYENDMKELIHYILSKEGKTFKSFFLPKVLKLDELSSMIELNLINIKPKLF